MIIQNEATVSERIIDGSHDFNHIFIQIGFFVLLDFAVTITHAVDPIGVPFHQNHTQNTKAHHNKFTSWTHDDASVQSIGIITIVIGILSIIDDKIAETHNIIRAVYIILYPIHETINCAK